MKDQTTSAQTAFWADESLDVPTMQVIEPAGLYHPVGFLWPKDFKPRYRVKAPSRRSASKES
jgi:hypothetical protein